MAKRKRAKSPADQAASPVNGVVPPVESRWKPGQSGNPGGRPSAGSTIREHINDLATSALDEPSIRAIAKDIKAPWPKRAAANRILRTMEAGDLADFAGLLSGENKLEDLRAMGINTEVVKKFKQKTRVVPSGNNKIEEVIEREIELFDRAGDDFDRIIDRTAGKPTQAVEVSGPDKGPIETKKRVDYDAIENEIRQISGSVAARVPADD